MALALKEEVDKMVKMVGKLKLYSSNGIGQGDDELRRARFNSLTFELRGLICGGYCEGG